MWYAVAFYLLMGTLTLAGFLRATRPLPRPAQEAFSGLVAPLLPQPAEPNPQRARTQPCVLPRTTAPTPPAIDVALRCAPPTQLATVASASSHPTIRLAPRGSHVDRHEPVQLSVTTYVPAPNDLVVQLRCTSVEVLEAALHLAGLTNAIPHPTDWVYVLPQQCTGDGPAKLWAVVTHGCEHRLRCLLEALTSAGHPAELRVVRAAATAPMVPEPRDYPTWQLAA